MGCNCGDNEYNIEIENNGSCEPTTPIYNISLANVGIDGFSPVITRVNETSSSFQLQITDVRGTDTTDPIPLLSYLDDNFVTNTSLASTLTAYPLDTTVVHKAGLETITGTKIFNGGIQANNIRSLTDASWMNVDIHDTNGTGVLIGYDYAKRIRLGNNTYTTLVEVIGDKFTYNGDDVINTSSLTTVLSDYVTNSSLSSTLSAYALNNQVVHLSGNEIIGGNKTFTDTIITSYIRNNASVSDYLTIDNQGGETQPQIRIGSSSATGIRIGNASASIKLTASSATLNDKNIATTDQIPTVGNGTITITQGGVSKGTFTTNQSGNTTIELDAGGGSITNPIELTKTYNDTDLGAVITSKLQLGFTEDDSPTPLAKYTTVYDYGGGTEVTIDQYILNSAIAKVNGGLKNNITTTSGVVNQLEIDVDGSTVAINGSGKLYAKEMTGATNSTNGTSGLVPQPSAGDEEKYLRGDGTWQTVSGGGTTYTAGNGIDITSNTISVKIDGTSITLNGSGELQASGSAPSVIDGGNA